MNTATGSFSTGTGIAGSEINVTGIGFQPQGNTVIIFFWNGMTSTTDSAGAASHQRGMGWTVGLTAASDNYAITNSSVNAGASAVCDKKHDNESCISIINSTPGIAGRANLKSYNVDGFTLNVLTQFSTSIRVHFIILSGTDITNIEASQAQAPATAQTVAYTTGINFQPDALLLMSVAGGASMPAAGGTGLGTDSHLVFGAAVGTASTQQAVISVMGNDAATTMLTRSYCRLGECFAGINGSGTSFEQRAVLDGFQSDGFRLNWTTSTSQNWFFYLCLKTSSTWKIGSFTTGTTDEATVTVSGLAITPAGGIVASAGNAESAAGTLDNGDRLSLGVFSGTGGRSIAVYDENGTANAEVATAVEHDAVYARLNDSAALQGSMRVTSLDSGGFTSKMTVGDNAGNFGWCLVTGSVASTPPAALGRSRLPGLVHVRQMRHLR